MKVAGVIESAPLARGFVRGFLVKWPALVSDSSFERGDWAAYPTVESPP